jgi:hypothetical protein
MSRLTDALVSLRWFPWQLDREAGLAGLHVYGDCTPMTGNHTPDDIQPETSSLADLFCRKERIEDVVLHVGWYAGAVVDNLDRYPVSVSKRLHQDPPLSS